MKARLTTVLLFLISGKVLSEKMKNIDRSPYIDIIPEFFQNKEVSRIILFVCWPIEDRVYVTKQLSQHFITGTYLSRIERISQKYIWRLFYAETFKIGIVFDMNCYNDTDNFLMNYEYFNSKYVWLVFSREKSDFTINCLNQFPLRLDTDMTIVNSTRYKKETLLKLYDVYNPRKSNGDSLNITHISDWDKNNQNRTLLSFETSKFMKRAYMGGMTIKVVVFIEHNNNHKEIDIYLRDEENPHLHSVCKLNYHLILLIQDMFNYSIEFVLADNWADKNSNDMYRSDNIIGILRDQKAHITACSLFLSYDRLLVAVPLHITYLYSSGFLFIDDNNVNFANLSFLSPFKFSIWISMTLITILLMILLLITIKCGYTSDHLPRLSDFFISIWGIWCQIGTSMPFNSISSRTAFMFLLFNAMIVYNFYTSSILSSVLNNKSKTYNLKDLADSKVKCGSFDEFYNRDLFKLKKNNSYTNEYINYFNSKHTIEKFYANFEEGLEKIRHKPFAFFMEYNTGYHYIENHYDPNEICLLQEIDVHAKTELGIYSSKNSEYENMFRVGLVKLRQHGFLSRALKKWTFKKPICQSNVVVKVNVQQVTSYFTILMIGMLLSLCILFVETSISNLMDGKVKFSEIKRFFTKANQII